MKSNHLSRSVVIAGFGVTTLFVLFWTCFGKNQADHWQVLQYPNGQVSIRNRPGWYPTYFARITTYPRMISVYGTKDSRPESLGDDSVKAWFNDGGTADISWVVRVTTPCPTEEEEDNPELMAKMIQQQREFHRQFTGNVANSKNAVRSAVRNVIQQTGPIMSSTENQSARKGEFWHEVYSQLRDGMYAMKPVVIKTNTGVSSMLQAMKHGNEAPAPAATDKAKPQAGTRKDTVRPPAAVSWKSIRLPHRKRSWQPRSSATLRQGNRSSLLLQH